MQRYYFFCNHVSFSNGFWVSVLRPPPQGLSVAPVTFEEIIKNDFLKWAQFLIILLKNDLSSRMTVYLVDTISFCSPVKLLSSVFLLLF